MLQTVELELYLVNNVVIASVNPMMGDFLRIPISSYPSEPVTIIMYSNASDISIDMMIGTSI